LRDGREIMKTNFAVTSIISYMLIIYWV